MNRDEHVRRMEERMAEIVAERTSVSSGARTDDQPEDARHAFDRLVDSPARAYMAAVNNPDEDVLFDRRYGLYIG